MFSELLSLKKQVKVLSTNMSQPPSAGGGGAAGVGNSTGYKYKQPTACPSLTTPSIIVADEDNQLPQPLLRPGDSWAAAAMS